MRNLKLTISYDGTNYCGWQRQKNSLSIQEILEQELSRILDHKVQITGSGRTDAGVHAKGQVANLFTTSNILLKNLRSAINSVLPEDIAVKKIEEVPKEFNSRFSAKTKVYRYSVYTGAVRNVFDKQYTTHYPCRIDVALMKKAAKEIKGTHDFSCFRSANSSTKTSVRTVKNIKINKTGAYIFIDIEADGFLYNMVRIIAGTLLEVGSGKRKPSTLRDLIRSRKRVFAGQTAKAHGLCLMQVKY